LHLNCAGEVRDLARRFAAMATHGVARVMACECLEQSSYPIIGEARARANRVRARFVTNHSQREIMALTVAKISIVADVHDVPLSCDFEVHRLRVPESLDEAVMCSRRLWRVCSLRRH